MVMGKAPVPDTAYIVQGCIVLVLKYFKKIDARCLFVTRSHEMSLKIWQFEISACLKSACSARYSDT